VLFGLNDARRNSEEARKARQRGHLNRTARTESDRSENATNTEENPLHDAERIAGVGLARG
jgi:hypothetical protein